MMKIYNAHFFEEENFIMFLKGEMRIRILTLMVCIQSFTETYKTDMNECRHKHNLFWLLVLSNTTKHFYANQFSHDRGILTIEHKRGGGNSRTYELIIQYIR